jgi:DNA polymerase-3 subunit epsilon
MTNALTGADPHTALETGRKMGVGEFVAIDFETATSARASACAIGIAEVSGGTVVEVNRWLIRPPGNNYDGINISIHGITPQMTEDSPDILEVWPQVFELIVGRPVLAHYAPFDIGVLRASLAGADRHWPTLTYLCTCVLARRAWPGWLSYRLDDVANACGVEFQHHEAGSDAAASASLGIAYCGATMQQSILEASRVLGVVPGQLVEGGWSPCSAISSSSSHPNYSKLRPTVDEVPEDSPFFGKTLVFTGTLDYFVRNEAAQHVVNVGGRVSNSISRKVDYLVCGAQDARLVHDGIHSSKMLKAIELRGQGAPIELITDGDFYRMLWQ